MVIEHRRRRGLSGSSRREGLGTTPRRAGLRTSRELPNRWGTYPGLQSVRRADGGMRAAHCRWRGTLPGGGPQWRASPTLVQRPISGGVLRPVSPSVGITPVASRGNGLATARPCAVLLLWAQPGSAVGPFPVAAGDCVISAECSSRLRRVMSSPLTLFIRNSSRARQ
jgi:hypothetical protein